MKQFIQQAKAAGKHDDALNLEANLREIQEEYKKRKIEEQKELTQNYEEFKDLFSKPAGKAARFYLGGCFFYLCFDFDIAARALLWGTENFKAIF